MTVTEIDPAELSRAFPDEFNYPVFAATMRSYIEKGEVEDAWRHAFVGLPEYAGGQDEADVASAQPLAYDLPETQRPIDLARGMIDHIARLSTNQRSDLKVYSFNLENPHHRATHTIVAESLSALGIAWRQVTGTEWRATIPAVVLYRRVVPLGGTATAAILQYDVAPDLSPAD